MARGDHIRAKRRGYWHHGIDCGDGTVIHYTGEPTDWKNAAIRRTRKARFAKGGKVEVVQREPGFDADAVITRAESRLDEASYHPLENNCEHFARWCMSGSAESRQVRRALRAISGVLATAAGVGLTVAVTAVVRRGIRRFGFRA